MAVLDPNNSFVLKYRDEKKYEKDKQKYMNLK